MTTLAALEKGYEFPPASFDLSDKWVDDYIAAVEDKAIRALGGSFVPPMAVAALAIRALLERASLPPGTLHAGQELAFTAPVRRGETLSAIAWITSRHEARGSTFLRVEQEVTRGNEVVLTGEAKILFPFTGDLGSPLQSTLGETDGAALPIVMKTITQEKIDDYALASGDDNPLHTNPESDAARSFGGTIAHGMLELAYVSEMLTAKYGEEWLASGRLKKVRFRAPARPGDTLTSSGKVTSVDGGKTLCEVECRNESGEVLVSGEAEVSR